TQRAPQNQGARVFSAQSHSFGGLSGSFRRLALFPVSGGGPGGATLAAAYAPGLFGANGRGLLPLDAGSSGRALGLNLPFWALVALFAAFSLVWSTSVGAIGPLGGVGLAQSPAGLSFVAVADRAAAVARAVRTTATTFPQAK